MFEGELFHRIPETCLSESAPYYLWEFGISLSAIDQGSADVTHETSNIPGSKAHIIHTDVSDRGEEYSKRRWTKLGGG